ncbi:flagellar motor protein [Desulfovirgula thermocuniculi]|uniref:flagellar motor protein n=1 Tax=Desulfovirgula thermocuniculi TaxID=348842 RepID=UPI000409BF54|nr:flagellar motor protein [Desulfovirgula thermocuniculi]
MDLAIFGFFIGVISLVLGFTLEGGEVGALIQLTAALIVFGGTIGATIFSFPFQDLKQLPKLLRVGLFRTIPEPQETIELIVSLANEARREGLLYLENRLAEIDDPFLRKGVQLVVDGTDPELVKSILEAEIYAIEERHQVGKSIFEAAGGYAPTMGIIGTVMGLVHVLSSIDTPEKLGPAIAMAFIATLYGVSSANLFWLPIASKLSNLSKKELVLRQLMLEGIVSLQAGYNPILIRERLTAFLRPEMRESGEERYSEE